MYIYRCLSHIKSLDSSPVACANDIMQELGITLGTKYQPPTQALRCGPTSFALTLFSSNQLLLILCFLQFVHLLLYFGLSTYLYIYV